MHRHHSISKKADMPVWAQLLGIALAMLLLIFLIWLAIRSGRAGVDILGGMP